MKALDNTSHSSGGYPELHCNSVLPVKCGLGEDVLFGGIRNVVPVPHELHSRRGEMMDNVRGYETTDNVRGGETVDEGRRR